MNLMRAFLMILLAACLLGCKDPGEAVRRDARAQLVDLVAELEAGVPIQTLEARLTKLKATAESAKQSFSADQFAKLDGVYYWGLGGKNGVEGIPAMLKVQANSPTAGQLMAKALPGVEKMPESATAPLYNQKDVAVLANKIHAAAKAALELFPP